MGGLAWLTGPGTTVDGEGYCVNHGGLPIVASLYWASLHAMTMQMASVVQSDHFKSGGYISNPPYKSQSEQSFQCCLLPLLIHKVRHSAVLRLIFH